MTKYKELRMETPEMEPGSKLEEQFNEVFGTPSDATQPTN